MATGGTLPRTLDELRDLIAPVLPDAIVEVDPKTLEVVFRSGRYLVNGAAKSELLSHGEACHTDPLLVGFSRLRVTEGNRAIGLRIGVTVRVVTVIPLEGGRVHFLVQLGERRIVLYAKTSRLADASFRLHNGNPLQWIRVMRA